MGLSEGTSVGVSVGASVGALVGVSVGVSVGAAWLVTVRDVATDVATRSSHPPPVRNRTTSRVHSPSGVDDDNRTCKSNASAAGGSATKGVLSSGRVLRNT